MRKETDMNQVKNIAISFLYQDVKECEEIPFLAKHPFFSFRAIQVIENGAGQIVDILEDADGLARVREQMKKRIMESNRPQTIFMLLGKAYRMAFFRYCNCYLGEKDYAELLRDSFTTSENPNNDINVPIKMIVTWFKKASKTALMDPEELEKYNNLPETFTVYRGIWKHGMKNGISWTDDMSVAEWFANRFRNNKETGNMILKAEIKKEDVLACFNERSESEIVCRPKKYTIVKSKK